MGPEGHRQIEEVFEQRNISASLSPVPQAIGERIVEITVQRSEGIEGLTLRNILDPLIEAGLTWDHVDPASRTWTAPPETDLAVPLLSWTGSRTSGDGVAFEFEDLHHATSL